jgi:hypothetical protein
MRDRDDAKRQIGTKAQRSGKTTVHRSAKEKFKPVNERDFEMSSKSV